MNNSTSTDTFLKTIVGIIGAIILLGIIGTAISGGGSSTNSSSSAASTDTSSGQSYQLNAAIQVGSSGLYVTNKESGTWTDCMVGVNGNNGWGFDSPPYKTHTLVSIKSGQRLFVPFQNITKDDGTQFDSSTQTVNSTVIECFQGTVNTRSWNGSTQ